MLKMDIEKAVVTMVEAMLPRFSGKLGLEVCLDLHWGDYNSTGENDMRRNVELRKQAEFLFLREGNYTKVFVRVHTGRVRREKESVWVLGSDHDSGWPGAINELMKELWREAHVRFGDTRPCESFGFEVFNPPHYVMVEYKSRTGERRCGVEYDVTLGEELSHREAVEHMPKERKS